MKRIFLLLLVILCAFCCMAAGDDSAVVGVGGTVKAMKSHPSVRMVSEEVKIRLYPERYTVNCRFVFKNEGKDTTVQMGFPENAWGDVRQAKRSRFEYFRTTVDGAPVKSTYQPLPPSEENEYTGWHIKTVPFKRGQTRVITVEYASPAGEISDGSRFCSYTMHTGSSWKGKIGRAVISADTGAISRHYTVLSIYPKQTEIRGNKIIWRFANLEPVSQNDISIRFDLKRPVINGRRLKNWEAPCRIIGDTLFMPARALERLKIAKITQGAASGECLIEYQGRQLKVKAGSQTAVIDETRSVRLTRAPVMRNDMLEVPIASVVKTLGGKAWTEQGVLYMEIH